MDSDFSENTKPKNQRREEKDRRICLSVAKKNERYVDYLEHYSNINNMSRSEFFFALIWDHHLRATGQK